MNVKINKYVLVLLIFILFFGLLSLSYSNSKHANNLYFKKIDSVFKEAEQIGGIFKEEVDNYLKNNIINKYSIKEIRDGYTNIKFTVSRIVNELKTTEYYKNYNKKYVVDVLEDVINTFDNKFLYDEIFKSDDEKIIVNLQNIIDNFNKVLNKYTIFKINFGLMDVWFVIGWRIWWKIV